VEANIALVQGLAGKHDPARRRGLLADLALAGRAGGLPRRTLRRVRRPGPGLAVALANDPVVILADGTDRGGRRTRPRRPCSPSCGPGREAGAGILVVTPQPSLWPPPPTGRSRCSTAGS